MARASWLSVSLLLCCRAGGTGHMDDLPDEFKSGGPGGSSAQTPTTGGASGSPRPGGGAPGNPGAGTGGTGGAGGTGMIGEGGTSGAMDAAASMVGDAGVRLDTSRIAPDAMAMPSPPEVGGAALPCKYTFCESFEAYAEGAAPASATWSRTSSQIVVGSQHVARGMRALHVPNVLVGQRYIRTTKPFPALGQAHYGRILLWIEQEPLVKPPTVNHWTTTELSDRATGNGMVVRTIGGLDYGARNNQMFFNIETHGAGETGRGDSQAKLGPKVWHCLEWYVNRQGNQYKSWWNGQERTALQWPDPKDPNNIKYTDAKYFFPEFKSLAVGLDEYQTVDVAWDIWIDEIALHTERIGCDG